MLSTIKKTALLLLLTVPLGCDAGRTEQGPPAYVGCTSEIIVDDVVTGDSPNFRIEVQTDLFSGGADCVYNADGVQAMHPLSDQWDVNSIPHPECLTNGFALIIPIYGTHPSEISYQVDGGNQTYSFSELNYDTNTFGNSAPCVGVRLKHADAQVSGPDAGP